ncbi:YifB family Mg chelatase-like AAA ATPase [Enemella sp. A6]|uniref:YifB family Mg chelatase-like AAA ATPase n=1 Tax=Enemella sp. A6 TaxID=3440152 RepID=UPI003EB9D60A
MSTGTAWSVALTGLVGQMVEVEAAIGGGLPRTVLVGLPDTALYEARDRCKVAVASSGLSWPAQLVTINLSPASVPKHGSHHDLGIAMAVLSAAEAVPASAGARTVCFGELGLDGRVRSVPGILPAMIAAHDAGFRRVIVPWEQVREACLIDDLAVIGVSTLAELVAVLNGKGTPRALSQAREAVVEEPDAPQDLADVAGQAAARFALEVAAAGRHHLYLHGPPGVGKTMLAERLPGLLPPLSRAESLEVSALHSLSGRALTGLIERPPYADPHHSSSPVSIIGGGTRVLRPGSMSLAHRGVLFLDEAPEFNPRVLESLRVPLESGALTVGRALGQAQFPARFQLVMAANPCPCGRKDSRGAACTCTPNAIRRYQQRISGPILDRIDIQQRLTPLSRAVLRQAGTGQAGAAESTATVAERVAEARQRQRHRLAGSGWLTNGEVPGPYLRTHLPLPAGLEILDTAVGRGLLSPRGVDKVLRVAWSIGDLAGADVPGRDHVATALAMRHGEVAA